MNFHKFGNQNINLDKVINFRREGEDLLIFDNPEHPFSFYDPDGKLYAALCDHVYGVEDGDVTYWMPLPEPPEVTV